MRITKEMLERWRECVRLYLAERQTTAESITSPRRAWDVAFEVQLWREAYAHGLNDNHIETGLRRIFPNAW